MSITGLFLILFLTMHMCINFISVFSPSDFEKACEFMSLPIVSIMVPILAAGFVFHIIYAFILFAMNRKASGGSNRYEVRTKTKGDSWASRNMIVLGIIVFLGLGIHLYDFWANMQLKNWTGQPELDPNMLMYRTFGNVRIAISYIIWFIAVWFHLTHGFWSAFQTIGWNNDIWLKRFQVIGYVVATILMGGFIVIAAVACCRANGWLPMPIV